MIRTVMIRTVMIRTVNIRQMLLPTILVVALAAAFPARASAQEPESPDKPMDAEAMKKKMAEISRLMRESERLLLEMTKADRLVQQQREIVEQLRKLKQPKAPTQGGTAAEPETDETKKKRKELKQRQREIRVRMEKLFENQENAARLTEKQLTYLLQNLPKGGGPGHPSSMSPGKDSSGQSPSDEKKDEQKTNDPKDEKSKEDDSGSSREREKQKKREKEAQLNRYDGWVARLPRAQQERISRGDFSGFPPRYRRLLREYTRLRAEREVERKREDSPATPR
jgi:hypothetical protein